MKKLILITLLAFSLPALAESTIKTAGEAEATASGTLKAIQLHFKGTMPQVQGDDFVDGAMNFSTSSKKYNNYWMMRFVDDIDQPEEYAAAIAAGKKLWETPFANGQTFAKCLPKGGKGIAAEYPKVNAAGKVETLEMLLNQCLVSNNEKPLDYGDMKTMGNLSLAARKLSDGARINITVNTDAEKAAFARGKAIFYTRVGKLEQTCANCHIQHAGKIARTEDLSPVIGHAAHFPVFRPNKATGELGLITLQKRYEGCQRNVQVENPIKPGSDESNDLEYFHTYLSNGLPLSSGVFRK